MKKMFNRGDIILRNINEHITFDAGDEFEPCIWICGGVTIQSIHDYNDIGAVVDTNQINDYNPIELFSGTTCSWGSHMFMTTGQFMNEYRRISFMMKRDPMYVKKLKIDQSDDILHTSNDKNRIQIINAIIKRASMFFEGVNSKELVIPDEIEEITSMDTFEKILEISKLTPFEFPTPSEQQIRRMEEKKAKTGSSDISVDEADAYLDLNAKKNDEDRMTEKIQEAMESYDFPSKEDEE